MRPHAPSSNAGSWWLNGRVWGIIVVCYRYAYAIDDGGYLSGLEPILLGVAVAGLGMTSNVFLCLNQLGHHPHQALTYGIGGRRLAGVSFWAMSELSRISKIVG